MTRRHLHVTQRYLNLRVHTQNTAKWPDNIAFRVLVTRRVRLQFTHSTAHSGLGRAWFMKVCALGSDLMCRQHVPLSNSWPSRFPSWHLPLLPVFPTSFRPQFKDKRNCGEKQSMCFLQHESVRICNRERVVNRVKFKEDTCARQFHPLKQKRFTRKTGNPSWLKQKQHPKKAALLHFLRSPWQFVCQLLRDRQWHYLRQTVLCTNFTGQKSLKMTVLLA
jgi:hypothetical protein